MSLASKPSDRNNLNIEARFNFLIILLNQFAWMFISFPHHEEIKNDSHVVSFLLASHFFSSTVQYPDEGRYRFGVPTFI